METDDPDFFGASNAGQFMLLIDPRRSAGDGFAERIFALVAALRDASSALLPSDERLHRRALAREAGIDVPDAMYGRLLTRAAGEMA